MDSSEHFGCCWCGSGDSVDNFNPHDKKRKETVNREKKELLAQELMCWNLGQAVSFLTRPRSTLKLHLSVTASQPFQPDVGAVSAVSQASCAVHPKVLAKPLPSPDIILIANAWQPLRHEQ